MEAQRGYVTCLDPRGLVLSWVRILDLGLFTAKACALHCEVSGQRLVGRIGPAGALLSFAW